MRTDEKALVEQLRSLARMDSPGVVREVLEGVLPEDIAEAFQRLDMEDGLPILQQMDPETAGYVLVELPTETARRYVNELPDATVAHYLDILPMDDAVELREELDPERFEALLHVIPREDAQEIRRLLSYPEGSAGQLMTERFLSVGPEATMDDVIAKIRDTHGAEVETVNYIYVLGEDGHLLGLLTLKRVLRSPGGATAREVMREDVVTVSTTTPDEAVARTMARYGFTAIPVLEDRGRMVGIVTADDATDILQDAATEDVLKLGAVTGDAEPYLSLSILQLVQRRLPWLVVLFVAEFFTGSVLRHYTGVAEEGGETNLAKLLVFVPLLIGAGGNSGSQVTTTITRALAVGEVRPADAFVVLRREFLVAVCVGSVLGLIGYARAFFGWHSGVPISIVVGSSLPVIILWATAVGSVLPLGAKRLGLDPAVMSAPFITTFVDATGLVIYFEIARRLLEF